MPAGNSKVDWSPKEAKLHKTANTEEQVEVQEEVNPLYEAAKAHMAEVEKQKAEASEETEVKEACGSMMDDDSVVLDVEVDEEVPCPDAVVEEVSDEATPKSVSEAVAEVEAKAEEAEAVVQEVAAAVDKIEEAVQDVKDVCGKGGEMEELEELEEDIPGEEVVDDEVVVEGEECDEEASMDKSASVEEEFCKFAKLSPSNRKKVVNYWVKQLGYPKDYVALMTKDYEK